MKFSISGIPNGPYLIQDPEPQPAARVVGANGERYPEKRGMKLCRCGGSKNKPFCDGTHRTNGFDSANQADPAKNKRTAYVGKDITIFDNRAICAHAGFCTDGLKEVFRMKHEPWIDPDGAARARVIETIRRCPSGALSYAVNGVEGPTAAREPAIAVTKDGPYVVTGGVELAGQAFGDGAPQDHYTLCRCGASKNKPFCDGSHWKVEFRDPA